MYRCAVCLIIKNESQYLIEWLDHYRNLGFEHFFIYNNSSDVSIKDYFFSIDYQNYHDVTIIDWRDENVASQQRAYLHCCQNQQNWDFILFCDTDEALQFRFNEKIQDFLEDIISQKGRIDGVGFYWRMYGENFETRHSIEDYKHYHDNQHIKSLVSPKEVLKWNLLSIKKIFFPVCKKFRALLRKNKQCLFFPFAYLIAVQVNFQ